jgi:hypothetical protein
MIRNTPSSNRNSCKLEDNNNINANSRKMYNVLDRQNLHHPIYPFNRQEMILVMWEVVCMITNE